MSEAQVESVRQDLQLRERDFWLGEGWYGWLVPLPGVLLAQGLHIQVARPFFVLPAGQCALQPQATRFIGEDARDVRAPFQFLIEALP